MPTVILRVVIDEVITQHEAEERVEKAMQEADIAPTWHRLSVIRLVSENFLMERDI